MGNTVRILENGLASFSVAVAGITPAATPTDVLLLKGAANKVISVRRIWLSGLATTAGQMIANLIRRSADNTAGTRAAVVGAPREGAGYDGAAAATFYAYSANASGLGAAVGTALGAKRLGFQLAAGIPHSVEWRPGENGMKPIKLLSATDFLAINFGGAAVPAGGILDYEIEWTER